MQYPYDWVRAVFQSRPNRFIALLDIEGETVRAHVPNTGRMKELLIPGTVCYCSHHPGTTRKTEYELRLVEYNGRLVSIDSQLPNRLAREALQDGLFGQLEGVSDVRSEVTFGNSRFDLSFRLGDQPGLAEVKGVTLAREGWGYFPDAPTQRGTKHLRELIRARQEGYETLVLFVLQNSHGKGLSPSRDTDPAFTEALEEARAAGVRLYALRTLTNLAETKATGLCPVALKGPTDEQRNH